MKDKRKNSGLTELLSSLLESATIEEAEEVEESRCAIVVKQATDMRIIDNDVHNKGIIKSKHKQPLTKKKQHQACNDNTPRTPIIMPRRSTLESSALKFNSIATLKQKQHHKESSPINNKAKSYDKEKEIAAANDTICSILYR